jgi:hypothetical protein
VRPRDLGGSGRPSGLLCRWTAPVTSTRVAAQRSNRETDDGADDAAAATDREDVPDLSARLDVWVSEGVIDRVHADAIATFESRRRPSSSGPRVTPVVEGLGYLGSALAIAAGATALGGQWTELSTAIRITIAAVLWLSLLAAGWRFRDGPSPALVRLSRVLWFLSAAALAWTSQLAFDEGFDVDGRSALLGTGVATTSSPLPSTSFGRAVSSSWRSPAGWS